MIELRLRAVNGDASMHDWRYAHNLIVPGDVLSLDDVRARTGRNLMEVACLGDVLIGCTTVRPPTEDNGATSTVIARVLPEHRRRGLGTRLHERALDRARALDARTGPGRSCPDRSTGPAVSRALRSPSGRRPAG
ncbi:GNAT family N-acetyltransferase [Streptomyces sp. NPDC002669]|uniref:GNAT family N-acetyltransferase n=1 Tax=Streptomyces sp. NPDC002669 TaxID=3364658 RepID=UPI00369FF700